jgi:hypothetical protein
MRKTVCAIAQFDRVLHTTANSVRTRSQLNRKKCDPILPPSIVSPDLTKAAIANQPPALHRKLQPAIAFAKASPLATKEKLNWQWNHKAFGYFLVLVGDRSF